jgi:cell wall-associated NlpC family hydrolase
VAALLATTLGVAAPGASADPLSSKRAQAQALNAKIQSLGQQEAALSEQYDAANLAVHAAQARVTQASRAVASAETAEGKAKAALTAEAVNAYINGGDAAVQASQGSQPVTSVDQSLIRSEYVGDLASTQSDAMDQYRLSALQAQDAKTNLQVAQTAAQAKVNAVGQDRQAVQAAAGQLQSTLSQVNGQIATLVAQAEAAQRAAQARAEQQALAAQAARRAAAAQAAQAAARAAAAAAAVPEANGSGLGGGASSGAGTNNAAPLSAGPANPPPPSGSGAGVAVAAAETRLGDPYVWGASGPSSFDCSGLVMWAWAQAGVSLPHFSGAQYALTTHIPIADVAPGDLVFPANPGEHVAMYVGGGQVIEAPYTGAFVHVIPMSGFFVLAGRVP